MKRIKLLEKAKALAVLHRKYNESIEIVDYLLRHRSNDIDALRLKGNILDLQALDLMQDQSVDSTDIQNLDHARTCYEKILTLDPENVVALIDMGDYWKHRENYEVASEYYNRAIELLKRGHFYSSFESECEEAFRSKAELLKYIGKTEEAFFCIAEGLRLCPDSELLSEDQE